MILMSACLCGFNCKYTGGNNTSPRFLAMYRNNEVIAVCPEELGGLSTPRLPCEIQGGSGAEVLAGTARVINSNGEDVSESFVKGAWQVLQLARDNNIGLVILQDRSPSCGAGVIYDGNFSKKLIEGDGVTAALLKQHGIKVINAADYAKDKGV